MKKTIITIALFVVATLSALAQTQQPTPEQIREAKIKYILEQAYQWLPTSQCPGIVLNGDKGNNGLLSLVKEVYTVADTSKKVAVKVKEVKKP
jgi:Na+-translocating ferredoxin:NAD+ oxidoreductase RnfG subunit